MSSHSQTLHSRLFQTSRAAHKVLWTIASDYSSRCQFCACLRCRCQCSCQFNRSNGCLADFCVLVAAETIPGNNPDNLTPVLRCEFTDTGVPQSLSSIPPYPASTVQDPSFVAFSPQGELFVANRHGNAGNGIGSIARFTLTQPTTSWQMV